ncbi:MAG: 3-keto-5-aminohexanoate cleavage protein [Amaricoccus sp.]|uniref:3-keto-5-aminohexanoate cleavage protein n=1 Tax=Amaricoccus sp. TaxID=1872485 RepID=UPI0039E729CA
MRLQACLNGGRSARYHPALPLTPQALARDAVAVREAGAEALYIHPRNALGRESLAAADVGAAIEAVRAAVPEMPVGVSTGAWIPPGGTARLVPMRSWTVLPDYVSVNVHEPEAEAIVGLMQARGVGIEAGVWTEAAARRFVSGRMPRYCLRVLVEMTAEDAQTAAEEAEAILDVLAAAGVKLPVLLHGDDACTWPMVEMAAERGLATRVGFEDSCVLPGGVLAASNAAMVAAAARILAERAAA